VAAGSGREGAAWVMLDLVRGQRRPSRQRQRRSKATAADLLHQGWKTSWVKWASGASKARRATAARKNMRRKQMASRFFGPKMCERNSKEIFKFVAVEMDGCK
jgi:hypothetical protein